MRLWPKRLWCLETELKISRSYLINTFKPLNG
jgi:hypothetical protein